MLSFIEKRAERFIIRHVSSAGRDHNKVISAAQDELYDIRDHADKVTFITTALAANSKVYQQHLPVCKDPDKCQINYSHEAIQYFLESELNNLGIQTNEDTFTVEEQIRTDEKLDKIIAELEKLKAGQEVVFNHVDEVNTELAELKDLYIYGKKKWLQLFLGKTSEMVIGGMISETVSKKLIQIIAEAYPKLLS